MAVISTGVARRFLLSAAPGLLSGFALLLAPGESQGAVTYDCASQNPALWPPASRPYFMLLVDTSGSMISCTNPPNAFPNSCASTAPRNSCGLEPTRINDAKCALRQTVQAFSGEVNFGMATFGVRLSNCSNGAATDSCTNANGSCNPPDALGTEGEFYTGRNCQVAGYSNANPATCGNMPSCDAAPPSVPPNRPEDWRNGGNIVVPMLQDPTWLSTPPASNVPELLKWFDDRTDESKELFALGLTPLEGILRTGQQYIAAGWNPNWNDTTYCQAGLSYPSATPLNALDRACRSVNFVLVTDGDETCSGTATSAASELFNTGVTIGANNFKIKTHVINFAGGTQSSTDAIALAGGTNASLFAANEAQLSLALSNIISGAIRPEICNNVDDNCNGCIDEGYAHHCNKRPTCCSGARATCLQNYQASISAADPDGNLDLLPCTSDAQQANPATWLCYDPKEVCDDIDNNCNGTVDEGITKCGNPLACPTAEICDGKDNDCDNLVDNAPGGCPICVPSAEICDGCDNDCNGVIDEGIPPLACGFSPPANCAGQRTCVQVPGTVPPGSCLPGHPQTRLTACSNQIQPEICNDLDDDCDGTIDNGVPTTACDIPNTTGLYYKDSAPNQFAQSQCVRGRRPCNGTCTGWIGPSAEICDGIDNDCNGIVDDNVPGVNQPCGVAIGRCTKGTTQCVGGVLVCQGGSAPQPEVCNGLDDDCNGVTDNGPLVDAPSVPGCWQLPPTGCSPVCQHQNLSWCAPPGATCTGLGTLASPCQTGTLVCSGVAGWKCTGNTTPTPEVCDGADNNCNTQVDDNVGPPVGTPCGNTVGECRPGMNICNNGKIECQGGIGPTPEICDGKDNNCNGIIDDVPQDGGGDLCWPTDPQYPGDRTKGECRPGRARCNAGTNSGQCVGGIGPKPEICDGRDNDCDGAVDEPGPQPDGVDGTSDPDDPSRVLGQECGKDDGECQKGKYVCDQGRVVCTGGVPPSPEICDCADNDCDGIIDNENEQDAGKPALCFPGKTCVQATATNCQCAGPCGSGEFPCPTGSDCQNPFISGTMNRIEVCISDKCGDCSTKTAVNTNGELVCAPTSGVPACVCKNNECRSPCEGRDCGASGLACVPSGPASGQCQPGSNCHFFGCTPGEVCSHRACVKDPCNPNPCAAGEVCKPNTNFSDHRCVKSCAGVACAKGEQCVAGACEPTGCADNCPAGEYCQSSGDAGAGDAGASCAPSKCPPGAIPCADGSYCNPATGACGGNHPCEGVKCPAAQRCVNGECTFSPEAGPDGSGGSAGTAGGDAGGNGGSGATDASAGASGSGPREPPRGQWGLATGGGGCACRTSPAPTRLPHAGALLLLFACTLLRRRKPKPPAPSGAARGRGAE